MGVISGPNPISPISIPRGRQSSETYAYSLEEIEQILGILPEPAKTAFAIAALAGLRQGEIRGLDWLDYDGENLSVARSVWRKHISPPKTLQSQAAVPVIKPLRDLLDGMKPKNASGSIFLGELGSRWIFTTSLGELSAQRWPFMGSSGMGGMQPEEGLRRICIDWEFLTESFSGFYATPTLRSQCAAM